MAPRCSRAVARVKLTPAGEACILRITRAIAQLREGLAELLRRSDRAPQRAGQLILRMTSAQLTALVAFIQHGTFRAAARGAGVAQPTLHRAARALERTLAVPLFEQTSFGIRATRDAEALCRCVRLTAAQQTSTSFCLWSVPFSNWHSTFLAPQNAGGTGEHSCRSSFRTSRAQSRISSKRSHTRVLPCYRTLYDLELSLAASNG